MSNVIAVPLSISPELKTSMGAEQRFKRSHDQMNAEIESGESSHHFSERSRKQSDTDIEFDESLQPTSGRSRDQAGTEIEVGESSKRPRIDERRFLDPRAVGYMQRKDSLCRAPYTSSTQEPTPYNYDRGPIASKAGRPSCLNCDRSHLLDPKYFLPKQQDHSPSKHFPSSGPKNSLLPSASNPSAPSRPSFNQLAADGKEGMKVLFLIDHATKGDAIHHKIQPFFHPTSSSTRLLMSKYRNDRSSFQNRFFAKARPICAHLTSRREFLEMEEGSENADRARRLGYFGENCSKAYLSTLYSPIASAVDVPKILAAGTTNEKAFKKLMTQVFIHSMEDLWWFEFHPSKQGLSAKLEKENKEKVYSRFKDLTDRFSGLPAARDLPGYLEVPLKANFPRYVLFEQGIRPRNEEDIFESDEEGGEKSEGGRHAPSLDPC